VQAVAVLLFSLTLLLKNCCARIKGNFEYEENMSKINGDKKRENVRSRRQTKMREKMREIRANMNAAAKSAAAPAAKSAVKPEANKSA
jgi:hypothetical protein